MDKKEISKIIDKWLSDQTVYTMGVDDNTIIDGMVNLNELVDRIKELSENNKSTYKK